MGFDPSGCDAEKHCWHLVGILQTKEQRQRQNSKDMIFIDGQSWISKIANQKLPSPPKATQSNQTSKSKFEFHIDKLKISIRREERGVWEGESFDNEKRNKGQRPLAVQRWEERTQNKSIK